MSKQLRVSPRADDEYELSPAVPSSSDPLLPSYSSSLKPVFRHEIGHAKKQRSRFRRGCATLCLCLCIVVPSLGLISCAWGERAVKGIREWDQVPADWKDWLSGALPNGFGGAKGNPMFPTHLGYAGATPTGSEPALLATAPAPPMHTAVNPLISPSRHSKSSFSIIQHWGNLSPYFSVESHGLPETNSLIPETCELDRLIWLQRHGARYPQSGSVGPAGVASRMAAAQGWKASGDLQFLNDWSYKLGAELLTPFGRGQLFDLGVEARIKYGFLLDKMDGRLPVFRTESQDRMLKSAQNFATGFFGIPAEEQYNLAVIIESSGFNNTMAPYDTCVSSKDRDAYALVRQKQGEWDGIFLAGAVKRLQKMMDGYEFTVRDAKDLMEMCAYETVSLGYSSFCDLFTRTEWEGFEYHNDLWWWYTGSFGYPAARAQGTGWVQELVSRLTETRLVEFNSTTNSSFHNDIQFPLHDPLMVDFTHDTVFALLLPTMNLTTFAESGDLPSDHIPKHRSFISSQFTPFATNLQIQVLSCASTTEQKQVRLILNDAAVPLTGINGCPKNDDGLCPLDAFVSSMQTLIGEVDWAADCGGV